MFAVETCGSHPKSPSLNHPWMFPQEPFASNLWLNCLIVQIPIGIHARSSSAWFVKVLCQNLRNPKAQSASIVHIRNLPMRGLVLPLGMSYGSIATIGWPLIPNGKRLKKLYELQEYYEILKIGSLRRVISGESRKLKFCCFGGYNKSSPIVASLVWITMGWRLLVWKEYIREMV